MILNFTRSTCIVLIFILYSCRTEYKLTEKDLQWQPYKQNDILIFESNKKEIDTIKINEIISYLNPEDHLSPVSNYNESLFVGAEIMNPNKNDLHLNEMDILKLYKDQNNTLIYLSLMKKADTLEYAQVKHTIVELEKMYNEKSKLADTQGLHDIVILLPNSTYIEQYDLESYWWSKQYGYIRYNFKNGYYRELKEFIRDGKNILPGSTKSE